MKSFLLATVEAIIKNWVCRFFGRLKMWKCPSIVCVVGNPGKEHCRKDPGGGGFVCPIYRPIPLLPDENSSDLKTLQQRRQNPAAGRIETRVPLSEERSGQGLHELCHPRCVRDANDYLSWSRERVHTCGVWNRWWNLSRLLIRFPIRRAVNTAGVPFHPARRES